MLTRQSRLRGSLRCTTGASIEYNTFLAPDDADDDVDDDDAHGVRDDDDGLHDHDDFVHVHDDAMHPPPPLPLGASNSSNTCLTTGTPFGWTTCTAPAHSFATRITSTK
jgi:hypothetical protein